MFQKSTKLVHIACDWGFGVLIHIRQGQNAYFFCVHCSINSNGNLKSCIKLQPHATPLHAPAWLTFLDPRHHSNEAVFAEKKKKKHVTQVKEEEKFFTAMQMRKGNKNVLLR